MQEIPAHPFDLGECLKEWAKTSFATEITEFSEKKTLRSLWALWLSPRNWTLPDLGEGWQRAGLGYL